MNSLLQPQILTSLKYSINTCTHVHAPGDTVTKKGYCVDSLGIQGLHCLEQGSDERLTDESFVLTRLLKNTEEKGGWEQYMCLPKYGVTTPTRDST